MKMTRPFALLLAAAVLFSVAGCADQADEGAATPTPTQTVSSQSTPTPQPAGANVVDIALSDSGVTVSGAAASTDPASAVYTGAEIIYYHDGTDESYGQGSESEKHSADEAAAHTVVTITKPGTYRLTGKLSKGQIAIDLGEDAKDDPAAVVNLILAGVDVTCTVAPALIFYNVYECDRAWVAYDNGENPDYEATPYVDTSAAGANVLLTYCSTNTFTGSHVARIYKEGTTKKLHKYDGAFYSRMSMNIGDWTGDEYTEGGDIVPGLLNIVADNEGLDSELHLTINSGNIRITSQDDGINTNEDFVSVTTVNGGDIYINAGLGSEGDGIDSNGYLVINGGVVWTMSNDRSADGGIDADSPILLNGGLVSAFGTRNDAADGENSTQPYMELAFASTLPAGSTVELKDGAGDTVWSATTDKACQSITLSAGNLNLDTTYSLYVDGVLQCWSGNSFGMMGGPGGQRPDGAEPPEGFDPGAGRDDQGTPPEMPDGQTPPEMPDGQQPGDGQTPPEMPDGMEPPEGFTPGQGGGRPDRGDFDPNDLPEDFDPGQMGGRPGGFGGQSGNGSGSTEFVLTETVKSFSGVCDSDTSGKTRVTFAVEGPSRSGRETVIASITGITPSVEGLDPALIQVTVTDDPSEDYSASCLLSEGMEAVNALLPTGEGNYTLTVAVVTGNETYTGATQLSFTVGGAQE